MNSRIDKEHLISNITTKIQYHKLFSILYTLYNK